MFTEGINNYYLGLTAMSFMIIVNYLGNMFMIHTVGEGSKKPRIICIFAIYALFSFFCSYCLFLSFYSFADDFNKRDAWFSAYLVGVFADIFLFQILQSFLLYTCNKRFLLGDSQVIIIIIIIYIYIYKIYIYIYIYISIYIYRRMEKFLIRCNN